MRNIIIKKETLSDIEQTWEVNSAAFETNAEADLVNRLRNSGVELIYLVGVFGVTIFGQILF
jgi:predicted N-acetyltransferase YhbS